MTPVPIVTVNHDGVKLMIRSLQCQLVVHTSRTELVETWSIVVVVMNANQYEYARPNMYSQEIQPE